MAGSSLKASWAPFHPPPVGGTNTPVVKSHPPPSPAVPPPHPQTAGPTPQSACEEVYTSDKLYHRRITPGQIKKMYDNWQGPRKAELLDKVGALCCVCWYSRVCCKF